MSTSTVRRYTLVAENFGGAGSTVSLIEALGPEAAAAVELIEAGEIPGRWGRS